MNGILLLAMFMVGILVPIMIFRMVLRYLTGEDIIVMERFNKAAKFFGDNNWRNVSGEEIDRTASPVHDNTIRYNWNSKPKRNKKPDPQVTNHIRAEQSLMDSVDTDDEAISLKDLLQSNERKQQS